MTREEFEQVVDEAILRLPGQFRSRIQNVEILIEDLPDSETGRRFGELLLGLYHGTPLTRRSVWEPTPPDLIFLYKNNLERISRGDRRELCRQIVLTLQHELGHYFGLEEEDLRDV